MTIREVIDRVLAYHPQFPADYEGCDDFKCGYPEDECTGIVSALVPTVDVIRKTIDAGANLLLVHEPTFYSTMDYPDWRAGFDNQVYEEKRELLDKHRITIWRDHDHMHAHKPDRIFTGVIHYLGWEEYRIENPADDFMAMSFCLPETTVAELGNLLKEKIGLNGLRYIGRDTDVVRKVAIVGHLLPGSIGGDYTDERGVVQEYSNKVIHLMENGIEAIIPGEVIDWTVMSYIRDAVALGKTKAVFNIGHFNMEELGMKYAVKWLREVTEDKVPVTYVPSEDIYHFM